MDRRNAIRSSLLGTGAFLLGRQVDAELVGPAEAGVATPAAGLPYHSGQEIRISTHEIVDNEVADAISGTEDWGPIGRGVHIREFNIPHGTHLVLGHVQEAGNYGAALYETLGIAINRSVWRCRVIWRMDWDQPATLNTHFHWTRM